MLDEMQLCQIVSQREDWKLKVSRCCYGFSASSKLMCLIFFIPIIQEARDTAGHKRRPKGTIAVPLPKHSKVVWLRSTGIGLATKFKLLHTSFQLSRRRCKNYSISALISLFLLLLCIPQVISPKNWQFAVRGTAKPRKTCEVIVSEHHVMAGK